MFDLWKKLFCPGVRKLTRLSNKRAEKTEILFSTWRGQNQPPLLGAVEGSSASV